MDTEDGEAEALRKLARVVLASSGEIDG